MSFVLSSVPDPTPTLGLGAGVKAEGGRAPLRFKMCDISILGIIRNAGIMRCPLIGQTTPTEMVRSLVQLSVVSSFIRSCHVPSAQSAQDMHFMFIIASFDFCPALE